MSWDVARVDVEQESMVVFAGNANPALAKSIARHLRLGLGRANVGRFSDGEINVEIFEDIRGRDVFLVQPTAPPSNEHLMELLIMSDACRRASAARITAVMPYFGYARQDRRPRALRVPISAKLVANMIVTAGIDRVLTVDLHSDQIQGFFDIPVDNVYASPVLLGDVWKQKMDNLVVVSPDVGGVVRARAVASRIHADLAIIDKRRERAGHSEVMHVIGEVDGRTCLLVDDIVDSAGTLCNAAVALKEHGAKSVSAYVTHGVLSGGAVARVTASPMEKLVITDSIPATEAVRVAENINQISIAPLLADAIDRIASEKSVSSLFD
jgi:ribose-phosphate pyrophosphokinase